MLDQVDDWDLETLITCIKDDMAERFGRWTDEEIHEAWCEAELDQEPEAKTFDFLAHLQGTGITADEAWQHAVEGFVQDPGEPLQAKIAHEVETEEERPMQGSEQLRRLYEDRPNKAKK